MSPDVLGHNGGAFWTMGLYREPPAPHDIHIRGPVELRRVFSRATTSPTIRPILVGTLTIILLSFSLRVVLRNPVWASNDVLFETTLRDHPENFRAHWFSALRRVEMARGRPSSSDLQEAPLFREGNP